MFRFSVMQSFARAKMQNIQHKEVLVKNSDDYAGVFPYFTPYMRDGGGFVRKRSNNILMGQLWGNFWVLSMDKKRKITLNRCILIFKKLIMNSLSLSVVLYICGKTVLNMSKIKNVDHTLSLLRYLRDQKNMEDFKVFLSCSLYCKEPKVYARLTDYLLDFLLGKKGKELGFERLSMDVLGRKKYDINDLNTLLETLSKIVQRFLSYRQLDQDTVQQGLYLSRLLAESPQPDLYQLALNHYSKAVEQLPEGRKKLYSRFQLKELQWNHPDTNRHQKKPTLLAAATRAYQDYDSSQRLLYACSVATHTAFMNVTEMEQLTTEASFFPKIFQELLVICEAPRPAIQQISDFLANYDQRFPLIEETDHTALRKLLVNCCMIQIQQGRKNFAALLSEIFNKIPPQKESDTEFVNQAIALGLGGSVEAMKTFVERAPNLMHHREQALSAVWAYYYFYTNKIGLSLEYLQKIEGTRLLRYKQRYHSLKIRALYVLVRTDSFYMEDLENALDAYAKYFKRDTILTDLAKEPYLQLHYFLDKMLRLIAQKTKCLTPKTLTSFQQNTLPTQVNSLRTTLAEKPLLFAKWIGLQLDALLPIE